jgi:hypothetical protein
LGMGGAGGMGSTYNNNSMGNVNVYLPSGSIPKTNNPMQQGKAIGIGAKQALVRRGLGTRRP